MKKTLTLKKKSILKPRKSTLTLGKSTEKSTLTLGKSTKKSTLTLGKSTKKSTLTLGKSKKEAPKAEKKVVKKPKKTVAPKPPAEVPVLDKAMRVDKLLAEKYSVWADCLPLSRGIIDKLIADYREDNTVRSIKLTMGLHVSKIKYLQNIIDKEYRVSLDGEEIELISIKHKEHAKRKIARLTQAEDAELTNAPSLTLE